MVEGVSVSAAVGAGVAVTGEYAVTGDPAATSVGNVDVLVQGDR